MSIPGLDSWMTSPQGRYVLAWERGCLDGLVADMFGFNAVQLGMPGEDFLRENRIPFKFRAGPGNHVDAQCDLKHLPFANASIDLVVLAHVLEFEAERHQVLREVERILVPEGNLVVCGFNPYSLWGLRWVATRSWDGFPWDGSYLSVPRVKDWLSLLNFEHQSSSFGCFIPPVRDARWMERLGILESLGRRAWPIAGGVYVLHAVKRVHGMRLVAPPWRDRRARIRTLAPAIQKRKDDDRYAA